MSVLGELELSAQPGSGFKVKLGHFACWEWERVSKNLKVLLKNRMANPLLQLRLRGPEGLGQGSPVTSYKAKRVSSSSDSQERMFGSGNRSSGSTRVSPNMLQLLNSPVPMSDNLLKKKQWLPDHKEARVRSLRDFP